MMKGKEGNDPSTFPLREESSTTELLTRRTKVQERGFEPRFMDSLRTPSEILKSPLAYHWPTLE